MDIYNGHPVLWKPQPKQARALSCPAEELFFGGAAGGGKTDFLLMDFYEGAAKYGKNWRGIIFRKTFRELKQIKIRGYELFIPTGAEYKQKDKQYGDYVFVFPNKATLELAYLESDSDVTHYQGQEYTWVGFDELGNYATNYAWNYMHGRLRNKYGIPGRMRATGNPGGVGHGWIKATWIDGHEWGKIFWREIEVEIKGAKKKYKISSCFIQSRLEDNPILMNMDKGYDARLAVGGSVLYRALRLGDWDIFAGQVFSEFNRERHVVKPYMLEAGLWYKFCSLDWGYAKPYSLGWYAINGDGRMVKYREWYGCTEEPNTGIKEGSKILAGRAWEQSVTEGIDTMVADPAIWQKDNDHPSVSADFEDAGWKMIKGNNDRINGLIMFHQMLQTTDQNNVPMLTFFPNCTGSIRTLPLLTPDPSKPEDVNSKLEDHAYDETRYAIMSEIAKTPSRMLERVNGNYGRSRTHTAKSWNPYERN